MSVILDVEDLSVGLGTRAGVVRAVDGVSFSVQRGRTLGIVGESGCGRRSSPTTAGDQARAPRPHRAPGGR